MAYIESQAVLKGVPRPGVRAHLYARNETGVRTGSLLNTEVTGQGTGGKNRQTIFSRGRFYFESLTTGNYIVYLQGGGFDGVGNPAHRMSFDIVDPDQVPSTALMFVDGQLYLFGNQSSATTLSYVANLVSKPAELAAINAGEGAKLAGIEAGADVSAGRQIWTESASGAKDGDTPAEAEFKEYSNETDAFYRVHRFYYTAGRKEVTLRLKYEGYVDTAGATTCKAKLDLRDFVGTSSLVSAEITLINEAYAEKTITLDISAVPPAENTTYQVWISIQGESDSIKCYMKGGACDALRS